MIELFRDLSAEDAKAYGLVLSAYAISHMVREGEGGWHVWVEEKHHHKALAAIERYLEENQEVPARDASTVHEYRRTFTGVWAGALLLVSYVAAEVGSDRHALVQITGSSASHILRGELYRAVTSLMVHASPLHLAGNILGIGLFGTAVCSVTGWGVSWLMILVTGIVGNLANALLYKTGHVSVGASTAVFGAIGLLAAYQFHAKAKLPGQRMKAWVPLGGGLALLGILGSGAHVDMTAHFFGFAAGLVLGIVYALFVRQPAARGYQAGALVVTLSLLAVSWMMAFHKTIIPG